MERNMEGSVGDISHLDADVLLPPRKRLLAGMKRLNSDVNSCTPSPNSGCSTVDARLSSLSKFHLSDPNRSNEEILEASRLAALEAEKFAKEARAVAEEKAAIAVKAVAAAKIALELVATTGSDEADSRDGCLKKNNKMKKHVPVEKLYNKYKGTENRRTDEELARSLHRTINSSPRILKNSTSDSRNHKHKRLKKKDLTRVDMNTSNSVRADGTEMGNSEASQSCKADCINMEIEEGEMSSSKEKSGKTRDDICSSGKRKGRLKQKKLPLSVCNSRDQASPKEDMKSKSSQSPDENVKATASNKPVFSVERTSMWKCQSFKTPDFVKPNKVMHS